MSRILWSSSGFAPATISPLLHLLGQDRKRLFGRRGVGFAIQDVERDVGFVADDPAVVARRDVEEVAALHQVLGLIVHLGDRLPAEHQADALDLAGGRAHGRRDVLGPAPARLVGRPTQDRRPDAVEVETPLLEVARLAGLIDVDELQVHRCSIAEASLVANDGAAAISEPM
jgi:hypothetical protein